VPLHRCSLTVPWDCLQAAAKAHCWHPAVPAGATQPTLLTHPGPLTTPPSCPRPPQLKAPVPPPALATIMAKLPVPESAADLSARLTKQMAALHLPEAAKHVKDVTVSELAQLQAAAVQVRASPVLYRIDPLRVWTESVCACSGSAQLCAGRRQGWQLCSCKTVCADVAHFWLLSCCIAASRASRCAAALALQQPDLHQRTDAAVLPPPCRPRPPPQRSCREPRSGCRPPPPPS
jgi:hypothetical protein